MKTDLEFLDSSQAPGIALLRFPPAVSSAWPFLAVKFGNTPVVGAKVTGIGFPLRLDYAARPGVITSLSGEGGLLQANAGWASGMSGGPVLDGDACVVGTIAGGLPSQSSFDFFMPVDDAKPLFERAHAEACSKPAQVQCNGRSEHVDETLDQHDLIAISQRHYIVQKNADPGCLITSADLIRHSDTRVSNLNIAISPDRDVVTLSFDLSSGPAFDRWRGWLSGDLLIQQRGRSR